MTIYPILNLLTQFDSIHSMLTMPTSINRDVDGGHKVTLANGTVPAAAPGDPLSQKLPWPTINWPASQGMNPPNSSLLFYLLANKSLWPSFTLALPSTTLPLKAPFRFNSFPLWGYPSCGKAKATSSSLKRLHMVHS